jgi:hypothetical protein
MSYQATLKFLHRTVHNLNMLVLYLSFVSSLPAFLISTLTLGGYLTPAVITLLTILCSFALSLLPETKDYHCPSEKRAFLVDLYQRISDWYTQSLASDLFFGIMKGLQSLTAICYFRASLSIPKTFRTPVIAGFVACLSTAASYYGKHGDDPQPARLARSCIDFSLSAITSFGFLYLLNTTQALPFSILAVCVISLVLLSLCVDSLNARKGDQDTCSTPTSDRGPRSAITIHPRPTRPSAMRKICVHHTSQQALGRLDGSKGCYSNH